MSKHHHQPKAPKRPLIDRRHMVYHDRHRLGPTSTRAEGSICTEWPTPGKVERRSAPKWAPRPDQGISVEGGSCAGSTLGMGWAGLTRGTHVENIILGGRGIHVHSALWGWAGRKWGGTPVLGGMQDPGLPLNS